MRASPDSPATSTCGAEGAPRLSNRAAAAARDALPEKGNQRFDPATLAAIARVYARDAALQVAEAGLRWVRGGDGVADAELPAFEQGLRLPAIHAAQAGLLADMNQIADALYDR